jgi:hypothetical protein
MRGFWLARAVKIVVIIAIVLGVVSFIAMSLWNWLVPALFSGPVITYWQALGLLVLCRLLFGGFHPRGRGHWGRGRHGPWQHMTSEERNRIRERLGRHRHGGCGPTDTPAPGV